MIAKSVTFVAVFTFLVGCGNKPLTPVVESFEITHTLSRESYNADDDIVIQDDRIPGLSVNGYQIFLMDENNTDSQVIVEKDLGVYNYPLPCVHFSKGKVRISDKGKYMLIYAEEKFGENSSNKIWVIVRIFDTEMITEN